MLLSLAVLHNIFKINEFLYEGEPMISRMTFDSALSISSASNILLLRLLASKDLSSSFCFWHILSLYSLYGLIGGSLDDLHDKKGRLHDIVLLS